MGKRMLMVTPQVVLDRNGTLEIDPHFENNITGYLTRVDHVTVACTPAKVTAESWISNSIPIEQCKIADRFKLILLPEGYREDRYLLNHRRVAKLIEAEIDKADYLTFAPHAPFDWPTLAAKIAIRKGRRYDVEADWDMRQVSTAIWSTMKPGPNKLRKYVWFQWFFRDLEHIMSKSSLALLQGADVFNAYRQIAPNPRKVLNIQVTQDDLIGELDLGRKLKEIRAGEALRIIYTGRATHMKGPLEWLQTLKRLHDGTYYDSPVKFHATWYGDGDMLDEMRVFVAKHRLGDCVSIPGSVSRDEVLDAMRESHLFLFCHLTLESPRCIVEALASATAVVGYRTLYTDDLVREHGGGEFVPMHCWQELAQSLVNLNNDRERLAALVEGARATSQHFDRDAAIRERIDLIVELLSPGE